MVLCNLKKETECLSQESPAGSLANKQEVRSSLSFSAQTVGQGGVCVIEWHFPLLHSPGV